jgi:hypothetical protein
MKPLSFISSFSFVTFVVYTQKKTYLQELDEKDAPPSLKVRMPCFCYNRSAAPFLSYRLGSPAFFLDKMPVDANTLSNLNINDVAATKVFSRHLLLLLAVAQMVPLLCIHKRAIKKKAK